jgi:SsrA-binding protein
VATKPADDRRVIAQHRRARFDYRVEETLEAGLQLTGSEVKSLREGTANLTDAYALPRSGEMFLHNAHIGSYARAGIFGHEPTRTRKLLLHRTELDRWSTKVKERGYSIIPLLLYFRGGRAKIELGLCKGKTHEDRRHDIKARETKREVERAMRRR